MHVLILGCGYVGYHLALGLIQKGIPVTGTRRDPASILELSSLGIEAILISTPLNSSQDLPWERLKRITHLIDSIPLNQHHGTFFPPQREFLPLLLSHLPALQWVGYLSTTAVYGDSGGAWVDETTQPSPLSQRGKARLEAETLWQKYFPSAEIFRLPGIYGPGRNILNKLQEGNYPVVCWNPPHYANRAHVADIVSALLAAIDRPKAGRVLNITDDNPCSHAEYATELAKAIGAPEPIYLTPEEAERKLSLVVFDFFRENKRVCNQKLHQELLPQLKYPSFREALPELVAEVQRRSR